MQMLAAEVDSVRIAKEDLEVTGALIRNLCMMNDAVTADSTLEYWKQAAKLEPKDKVLIRKIKLKKYLKE